MRALEGVAPRVAPRVHKILTRIYMTLLLIIYLSSLKPIITETYGVGIIHYQETEQDAGKFSLGTA